MTDEELIQALRCCTEHDAVRCETCPCKGVRDCADAVKSIAADRMASLLRERAELNLQIQKEICKRVDVERENEELKRRSWTEYCEDMHEYNCPRIPRWVSVEERLPQKDGRYLCVKRIGKSEACYVTIMNGDKCGFSLEHIYSDDVTHWMTLPEPPSTEGGMIR